MKKVFLILVVMLAIGITGYTVTEDCNTVKQRTIPYSAGHYLNIQGEVISPGYDDFGYNYQAHLFNGYYANAYLGADGFPQYEGNDADYIELLVAEGYTVEEIANVQTKWYWPNRYITLMMKWSDTWLSNKDCNGDGKLDRGYSCDPDNPDSSACEGAWLTNHQSGTCVVEGKEHRWTYFLKVIYPTGNAYVFEDYWYTADGTQIGPTLWGAYAIIQQVDNDPCADAHGITYKSPAGPGFGKEW